jgi:hypothetical protein
MYDKCTSNICHTRAICHTCVIHVSYMRHTRVIIASYMCHTRVILVPLRLYPASVLMCVMCVRVCHSTMEATSCMLRPPWVWAILHGSPCTAPRCWPSCVTMQIHAPQTHTCPSHAIWTSLQVCLRASAQFPVSFFAGACELPCTTDLYLPFARHMDFFAGDGELLGRLL